MQNLKGTKDVTVRHQHPQAQRRSEVPFQMNQNWNNGNRMKCNRAKLKTTARISVRNQNITMQITTDGNELITKRLQATMTSQKQEDENYSAGQWLIFFNQFWMPFQFFLYSLYRCTHTYKCFNIFKLI